MSLPIAPLAITFVHWSPESILRNDFAAISVLQAKEASWRRVPPMNNYQAPDVRTRSSGDDGRYRAPSLEPTAC